MAKNNNTGKAMKHLYPDKKFGKDYTVEDDGKGAEIVVWNIPGPRPTNAEIDQAALDYDAAVKAKKDGVKGKRGGLLGKLKISDKDFSAFVDLIKAEIFN